MSDAVLSGIRSTPIARLILLTGVFLLPVELPFTEAMHFALSRFIGDWYLLSHPFTLVLVGGVASRAWTPRRVDIVLVAMGVGILASTIILHGNLEWTVRYMWFGMLSISLMTRAAEDREVIRAFVFGLATWAVIGLAFYAVYFAGAPASYGSLAEKIMALRSPGPEIANHSAFFQFLGNMNKAANYALLAMLLVAYCQMIGALRKPLAIIIYVLMIGILVVTFSRGALVVCGLIAIGFWLVSIRVRCIGEASLPQIGMAFVIPLLVSLSTSEYRAYWGNLETVETRVLMAKAAITEQKAPERADLGNVPATAPHVSAKPVTPPPPASPRPDQVVRAVFGYGVGNYGAQNFHDPIRGTHNLFVDIWTDGGLLALGAFVVYLLDSLWCLRRGILSTDPRPFIAVGGIVSIVILGFREYDLAYLFATSLGGALVGLFCGLARETGGNNADFH